MKTLLSCCLAFLFFSNPGLAQTAWIIGGQPANEGQIPWLGDLRIFGSHLCGSALIHPKWVLTAGHCVLDAEQSPGSVRIRLNTIDTDGPINANGGVQSKGSSIFIHPDFDINDLANGNDIALIYLMDSITSIEHAILPYTSDTADKYQDGSNMLIAGWGITDTFTLNSDNILQWTTAKIYPIQECNDIVSSSHPERFFCIGYMGGEEAKGSAAGDSGGPSWKMVNDKPVVYGIVSGGTGGPTTLSDLPGIFTKVARYRPWIDSVMMTKGSTLVGIDKVSEEDIFASKIKIIMDGYQLQIQLNTTDNEPMECGIWDMQGRLVFSRQIPRSRSVQYNIPLDHLASGAYVFRINNKKGQQLIRKIAKH